MIRCSLSLSWPVGVGVHSLSLKATAQPIAPTMQTPSIAPALMSHALKVLGSSSILGRSGECKDESRRLIEAEERLLDPGRPIFSLLLLVLFLIRG